MYNAYMIRNDGKEIPVKVHPYGSLDNYEETLYASEWLYKNTQFNSTKKIILDFIKTFAVTELKVKSNFGEELIAWAKNLPYKVFEDKFISSIVDKIETADVQDINDLNVKVCHELNQEFLRARLGGYVNTSVGSKEMVFRVSSVGFNWFNLIYMFVYDHKREISSITIAKDEESTGYEDYFYNHRGYVFNQMPINEFLEMPGNPVVEAYTYRQKEALKEGNSIISSFGNLSYKKLNEQIRKLHHEEIKEGIWQKQNH